VARFLESLQLNTNNKNTQENNKSNTNKENSDQNNNNDEENNNDENNNNDNKEDNNDENNNDENNNDDEENNNDENNNNDEENNNDENNNNEHPKSKSTSKIPLGSIIKVHWDDGDGQRWEIGTVIEQQTKSRTRFIVRYNFVLEAQEKDPDEDLDPDIIETLLGVNRVRWKYVTKAK